MPRAPRDDQRQGWATVDRPRRPGPGRHARRSRVGSWVSAVLASLAVLGIGMVTINVLFGPVKPTAASAGDALVAGRTSGDTSSRDFNRSGATPPPALGILAVPAPGATQPAVPSTSPAARHKPVAGLTQSETDNAAAIVKAAHDMNLPKRAAVVAIATALQETHLRNLANSAVPQSLKLPHQGLSRNFDSIGLFQQRPSQGWGTVTELMNPGTSARKFYERLVRVSGWEKMDVGEAAQAVQRSAFPSAYDKHVPQAQQIVAALS